MILFRTSNPKRRNSLQFLKTQSQQTALLDQLEKQSWINEIFQRTLPIPPEFQTRFGPPGFSKNPFYASEKKETTFFEFGYGLLKRGSFYDKGIAAICYDVSFQGKKLPFDITQESDVKSILDPKTYGFAHNWILHLTLLPESLRYPAVRDPNGGGINFSIYERSAVGTTLAEVEDIELTPRSDGSVEMFNKTKGSKSLLKPIR